MTTGYAHPNTTEPTVFAIDIGKRNNPVIDWRPLGGYTEASVQWTWGLEPGALAFELHPKHPMVSQITNVRRTCYHVRTVFNGRQWDGRIMSRKISGPPGRERFTYTCVSNKYWLQRWYAWVNPLMPPEIQVTLTGKQAICFGPPDPVFKFFLAQNMVRLDKPVFMKLPFNWPPTWTQPNLAAIATWDDLFELIFDATEELVALMARFTQGDDLFRQTVERLEMGADVTLWDGRGTSPQVFNTTTLGNLQSIIDATDDHFLDLGQLASVSSGLYSLTADRACYVFDSKYKRDNRKVQWRTDAPGQITSYEFEETHADAFKAIVGGKSPSVVNDLIEIGANLAIQLLLNLAFPGLGLGAVVGDLFDDIFFAYQVFTDDDVEDDIGEDDAFPEIFADNTAAWSIDSYAIGKTALHEHGGKQSLTINASAGTPDGRGITFGADNSTARRFDVGDIMTFWDRGNIVEQYCSSVTVTDKPGERLRTQVTLGDDKRTRGAWTRAITGLQGLAASTRGFANAT